MVRKIRYISIVCFSACMFHTAEIQFGGLFGKIEADLECGCGILSVESGVMGCDFCLEIDIDGGKLLCFTFTLTRVFLYKILNYFAWSSDLSIIL